jgi:hypothetical protein
MDWCQELGAEEIGKVMQGLGEYGVASQCFLLISIPLPPHRQLHSSLRDRSSKDGISIVSFMG